jgi:hypothetical protein
MSVEQSDTLVSGRDDGVHLGSGSAPEFDVGLAELAEILTGELPEGLPDGPRRLAVRLREDDEFARRVWAHPMYVSLVSWARDRFPRDHEAWEDMATYALSRAALCQDSVITASAIRAGMWGTAAWVRWRGRELERLDRPEPSIESVDLVAETTFPSLSEPAPPKPPNPVDYLADALGGDLPVVARDALEKAWRIAHDHYLWLANLTGLRGEALLAAGQAKGDVNPQRRLGRRLPPEWPVAKRKAVVHLLAGTPRRPGLLAWWSSTPVDEVPMSVRSRWQGLVIVIDPAVAGMTDSDRRLVREQAQRWQPAPPMPAACDQGIAV